MDKLFRGDGVQAVGRGDEAKQHAWRSPSGKEAVGEQGIKVIQEVH